MLRTLGLPFAAATLATAAMADNEAAAAGETAAIWGGAAAVAAAAALALRERLARKKALAAHQRREALERALDSISSGFVALDAEGRIAFANAAAREMLDLGDSSRPEARPGAARLRPAGTGGAIATPIASVLGGGSWAARSFCSPSPASRTDGFGCPAARRGRAATSRRS